jgi:hypothetical protein
VNSLVANLSAEIQHCDGLKLDALARLALRVEPGKSELNYGAARTGPWRTVEDVELATLSWVNWRNTSRLHGYLDDEPPPEFEATFYAANRIDQPPGRNPIARASIRSRAIHHVHGRFPRLWHRS